MFIFRLLGTLLGVLCKYCIDLKMMAGYSSDTCNTMFGQRNSVATHLKRQLPMLATIKCACHSIHLTSSKACAELPDALEEAIKNICSHFSTSSQRNLELKKFQE